MIKVALALLITVTMLVTALFAGFMYLLYTRRCPMLVARAWFSFCTVLSVLICFLVCVPLRFLADRNVIARHRSESLCCVWCSLIMGTLLSWASPHIRIKFMEGSLDWRGLNSRSVVCACHTSFFDTIFFLWLYPTKCMWNVKSFAKHTLWKLPLMGEVIRACGHFPVYFTSKESSSFSVDKDKQAKVAADAEEFVSNGGSLCFFPEGALNKAPEVLSDFRLGSFNMIVKYKLPITYLVYFGCHEVWSPTSKELPGYPTDVYVYVGTYNYEPNAEVADVARGLRERMQKHLDDIQAKRKADGYLPQKKHHA